ncbi:Pregnancy zone protein [Anabarilius grahami]|uniref:Pregnancy zone protein n=1 Tax=Anabarilius grahami TaxID=495550 RepID=A0A3N0XMZ2_ANAGA|nr:Pregnancy zone protein [Anabarilius grahami]
MVTFPAVIESGSDAKLCATLLNPQEHLTMTVSLLDDKNGMTELVNVCSKKPLHRCFGFKAPRVHGESVQNLKVEVKGKVFRATEERKVMFKSYLPLTFIQTDKPIYNPGQTVRSLSGYPYSVEDEQECTFRPRRAAHANSDFIVPPKRGPFVPTNKAYTTFKCMQKVNFCFSELTVALLGLEKLEAPDMVTAAPAPPEARSGDMHSVKVTVRSYFPETWIWQLAQVGATGSTQVPLTVPDTITTWETEVFCLSSKGLGLAPPAQLTVFQPFFLELSLPYSIIRGENFELKATVFSYLSKCIMVKVTPASSTAFTLDASKGPYSSCLCDNGRKTFKWVLTASVLGPVNVTVNASAEPSRTRCGTETVTVPKRGRVDIVTRSLLVLGGVGDSVTMTAYVVVSLLELGIPVTDPVITNALSCLRPVVGNLGNTYATALLAYSFSLAGETSTRSQLLTALNNNAISEGTKLHWSQTTSGDTLAVEISSYVLLAVLTEQPLSTATLGYANRIVNWLMAQQNPYGGFSSTQDTVVALHALSVYAAKVFSMDCSSTVTVQSSVAGGESYSFTVNRDNRLLFQEKPLKNVPGKYSVKVSGSSCVSVQVACFYNIPTPVKVPKTLSVEAKVKADCQPLGANLMLNFTVMYNGAKASTNMVIVDIKLLSGFTADTSLLGSSPQTFAPLVERVDAGDDGVLVYLKGVPKGVPMTYTLKLNQVLAVNDLKPAVIKVYDYYQTSMLVHLNHVLLWLSSLNMIQLISCPSFRSFMVTFPAVIESGSDAKLCATLLNPQEHLTMTVSLLDDKNGMTELVNVCSKKPLHRCFGFKAPRVHGESVQNLKVEVKGKVFRATEERKVMFKSYLPLTFIQTDKPIYNPGQTVIESGSDAKLCATLLNPQEHLTMTVSLLDDKNGMTELVNVCSKKPLHRCFGFKAPRVHGESVQNLKVEVKGKVFRATEERKVMFKSYLPLTFIQTDKPIYNPGQTVNFRVVTMDVKFVPLDQMYNLVVVEDINNNRIGQWTNVSSTGWILQLSHQLNSEAQIGMYTLKAFIGDRGVSQVFEVKKYVLPKFDVTVNTSQTYSVADVGLKVEACAKYTYGQTVPGQALVEVCRDPLQYVPDVTRLCLSKTAKMNATGCASFTVETSVFFNTKFENGLQDLFVVTVNVTEEGTDVVMSKSATVSITFEVGKVTFVDLPDYIEPGSKIHGKAKASSLVPFPNRDLSRQITVSRFNGTPIVKKAVYLLDGNNHKLLLNLTTNQKGLATFSLNTANLPKADLNLVASATPGVVYSSKSPYFTTDTRVVRLLQPDSPNNPSLSELTIVTLEQPLKCGATFPVTVKYSFVGESGDYSADVVYMVLSRGMIVLHGFKTIKAKASNKVTSGSVSFQLSIGVDMAPAVQILVFCVLPSENVVVVSASFDTEACFQNKVSLEFSPATAVPAEGNVLKVSAQAGSLCGLSVVDQSVWILEPGRRLSPKMFCLHRSFMVTFPAVIESGSDAKLCATLLNPQEHLTMTVSLLDDKNGMTELVNVCSKKPLHRCFDFKAPRVHGESVQNLKVEVKGKVFRATEERKVMFKSYLPLTFIQTDKPIYNPGQTVNFRVVTMDVKFVPLDQMYNLVVVEDNNNNRIGQWTNVSSTGWILQLSHQLNSEAQIGMYTLKAFIGDRGVSQVFEVKKYVLPKFDVTVNTSQTYSVADVGLKVEACAKYTYGQPVPGQALVEVCRDPLQYVPDVTRLCLSKTAKMNATGCASFTIETSVFFNTKFENGLQDLFVVTVNVTEEGTDVVMSKSATVSITFEVGKITVSRFNGSPIVKKAVYLLDGNNHKPLLNLTTNQKGLATFSLNTANLPKVDLNLVASATPEVVYSSKSPYFTTDTRVVRLLQPDSPNNPSLSELTIVTLEQPLKCGATFPVTVKYSFVGESCDYSADVVYMVLSRGMIVLHGFKTIKAKASNKVTSGSVSFQLSVGVDMAPAVQILVFCVLPSENVVVVSASFDTEACFQNKVSLEFSPATAVPAEENVLKVSAQAGSLCGLSAVDQSVWILEPGRRLSPKMVFDLLPVRSLSGYPYSVEDEQECTFQPRLAARANSDFIVPPKRGPFVPTNKAYTTFKVFDLLPVRSLSGYPYSVEDEQECTFRPRRAACANSDFIVPPKRGPFVPTNKAYTTFKSLGMKVATNLAVRAPPCWRHRPGLPMALEKLEAPDMMTATPAPPEARSGDMHSVKVTVRSYFPETWIWQLAQVGATGSTQVPLTVPDTITTWETEVFCLSSKGLGLAPPAQLTVFQPFFLELSLPYSIIRGENFELKATVFSYLSKCIMVKVTPASSTAFTLDASKGPYSSCLCDNGRKTFKWVLTASVLGPVNVTVNASAEPSRTRCGTETVTVPKRGRVDVVTRSLLVLAEGVERTSTQSWLLCPKGDVLSEDVTLTFPTNVVQGSARCSVSVLGDIMGHALKNLDKLLRMPYGCGEQNMIILAPNIYILLYLEVTGQLTAAIRETAIGYLRSGYQRQLNYRHKDGSFSTFGYDESNTWLTAFVVRTFGLARQFIFTDPHVLQSAKDWLISKQGSDGCFIQQGTLHHYDMKGGVGDSVTMTAYVVVSLLELGIPVTDPVITNALSCLRPVVGNLRNTYTTALLAYSFSLAGETSTRSQLLTALKNNAISEGTKLHWSQTTSGDTLAVEISSYVLLAVLTEQPLSTATLGYANRIVNWLVAQQNPYGGFSSTQDTVVALHALSVYAAKVFSLDCSSTVTVQSSVAAGESYSFTVNRDNRLLFQEKPLKNVPGKYSVKASGSSCVSVQVACFYNIPTPVKVPKTLSVDAKVKADCQPLGANLMLNFTVMYNGAKASTNMVIVDIKLLSGFTADTSLLGSSPQTFAPLVERVDAGDDGVLVYLKEVPKGVPMTYTLKLNQVLAVNDLKPAVIKIYDYYQTSDAFETTYIFSCPICLH